MGESPQDGNWYCTTPGCNKPRPREGRGFLKLCWTCRHKAKAKKYPERIAYNNLKQSAKRRGISFSITFEEWTWWCRQTNYMHLKGRKKGDMTVGRINHDRGYSLSNIVIEKNGFNSSKKHHVPDNNEENDNEPF